MANIAFGSKYFIFSKFSSIPKTSKIEQDRAALVKEYDDLNTFAQSQELEDFYALEKYMESKQHKDLMASLQADTKNEQEKIDRYNSLKKSKKFKNYFKFKESPALKNYLSFSESRELNDFLKLEEKVTSREFESEKKSFSDQKSREEKKSEEFNKLKKSGNIKGYFKFQNSTKLKEFEKYSTSSELKSFLELEKYINSSEFKKVKSGSDPREFKNAPEYKKEQEFEILKKSGKTRFYFKFKNSAKYSSYLSFKNSSELKKYDELEEYLNSEEHKELLAEANNRLTELNNTEKEYHQKKKSASIKSYFKFKNSQKYKDFQTFGNSKELSDYLKLEEYLNSAGHHDLMKSLETKEKEEADKKNRYETFKNSKQYKWYIGVKDSNKFDELKKWNLVFEDNFENGKLDREKWMTRYYWGDKLLNEAYALEPDKAFPTDGKNLEFSGSSIKIVTRPEKTEGKVWKQPFGFVPQEFNFTTGMISSAKSHRQKFGKFEAKIKVNYAKPVNYNFWMASEKNLPHVDILKVGTKKSKLEVAHHIGDLSEGKKPLSNKAEFSGLDLSQDFFIYTLEWRKDRLTWKINDVVVNEQKQDIPAEDMYLVFSSSMTGKADGAGLPASMEIDWVRCFEEV
ncbi:MAG: family 16 glycosylhydrolase [Bacteroidales bacterium]|nr:family 16 glycosylhydrolase [Bacteroidales bacterium]